MLTLSALCLAVHLSALWPLAPAKALVLGFVLPAFLLMLLPYVWPALGALLLVVAALAFRVVVRWWVAHKAAIKSEKVYRAGLIIADACRIGAGFVEQAVAPQLRDPSGLLTPAGAAEAKAAAIGKALEWLTQGGAKEVVMGDLKLSDTELEQRLGVGVEAQVAALPDSNSGRPLPSQKAEVAKAIVQSPSGERNIVKLAPAGA